MQEFQPRQMRKLKESLKSLLKKESFLADIFLFGSALKSKEKPRDVDVIALVREKDYEKIENAVYSIKKLGDKLMLNLHIESIVIDNLFGERVYSSIIHEGFSIREMKFIRELLNFKSYMLFTYKLENKKQSDKVRFSYALYGRKKGEGLLKNLKGEIIGKSSILIPIEKQEIMKSFLKNWNIEYKEQRVSIFEQ